MKIGIIYFKELQWTENQLISLFKKRGINIHLIQAQELNEEGLEEFVLLLNRVYASTANKNNFNFREFVKKLERIEEKGITIINSSFCSKCDYYKHFAAQIMKEKNVLTPETRIVSSIEEVENFLKEKAEPIIFKPNTGGRGVGVYRIEQIEEHHKKIFSEEHTKSEDFIVQSLAKSIIPIDYRIFVYKNKILCVNARTLVEGWLGSRSQGSQITLLKEFPKELAEVAINATKAIDARINSLDIIQTEEGFSVIENNPTPNFNESYVESFGFNPIEMLVEELIKEHPQAQILEVR